MKKTRFLKWFFCFILLFPLCAVVADAQPKPRKKDLEKARKLAQQGDRFFNLKNYRGAIEKYSEALTIVPQFPAAHFWKGYSYYYLSEFDQSLNSLKQAEAQGFDKPLEIYKLRWYLNYQAKNYDAALTDAQAAARLDPNNVTYNLAIGDIYRERKNCSDAIPYYKKAAEQSPNNGDIFYYQAFCYAELKDTENQGINAKQALDLKTKYVADSYFYLADALTKQKRIDEAAEIYPKVIDLKPEYYAAYVGLADYYRNQNEFGKAIEVARKGIRQFPQDAGLYTSLAWYYSLADRHQDAILMAQSAINIDPNPAMPYTNLCRAYNDAKEYQKALNACNGALIRNPGDGETYYYMGRAYEFLKQTDKAADSYKKAIEGLQKFTRENPDYSDGFYLLGGAYFAIGDDNGAITAYNKCLSLAPRFARARYALGLTYLIGKKDKVKAREQYNLLREVDANLAEKLKQAIESAK